MTNFEAIAYHGEGVHFWDLVFEQQSKTKRNWQVGTVPPG